MRIKSVAASALLASTTAYITLDGSRPSRVSFGTDYHWSSGSLDNTVDHTARVVDRSQGGRSSDTVTVAACR